MAYYNIPPKEIHGGMLAYEATPGSPYKWLANNQKEIFDQYGPPIVSGSFYTPSIVGIDEARFTTGQEFGHFVVHVNPDTPITVKILCKTDATNSGNVTIRLMEGGSTKESLALDDSHTTPAWKTLTFDPGASLSGPNYYHMRVYWTGSDKFDIYSMAVYYDVSGTMSDGILGSGYAAQEGNWDTASGVRSPVNTERVQRLINSATLVAKDRPHTTVSLLGYPNIASEAHSHTFGTTTGFDIMAGWKEPVGADKYWSTRIYIHVGCSDSAAVCEAHLSYSGTGTQVTFDADGGWKYIDVSGFVRSSGLIDAVLKMRRTNSVSGTPQCWINTIQVVRK